MPHLIYLGEYFSAPVRNDAGTVWMRERQVEAMYRARLDQRRNAHEALDFLYNEVAAGRGGRTTATGSSARHSKPAKQNRDRTEVTTEPHESTR